MPKTKISEFNANPALNTDIDSINIAEGCAPSGINDAIRELMAQLKDFQTGAVGDSFNGPIGTTTAAAGAFTTLSATSTLGVTGVSTLTGGAVVQGLTVGRGAGAVSTNTAVGASALNANTSGASNSAVGNQALKSVIGGSDNTAFGTNSMRDTSTGNNNTAVGSASLIQNTTGANNTAIGQTALFANTTASNNTAVGYQAGYLNTTGDANVYIGRLAGSTGTTARLNTFVGDEAGGSITTGASNTFIGNDSGYAVTTGSKNSILGSYSGNQGGLDIRTSSNHIVLSDGDGNPRGIFNSSGTFLVNTTTTVASGEEIAGFIGTAGISAKSTGGATRFAGAFWNSATTGDNIFVRLYTDTAGTERGAISYNRGAGLVVYGTTSDYRAKDIIGPVTGSGALIDSTPVYMGKMKGATQERPMFIAHETPDYAHTGEKDAVDENGKPVYQQMDASSLVPILWAEVQSLRKRLADAGL